MVGATTRFCGAASRTRFLRYSAIRKSLLSWRWRPCSLDSAPRAMTMTVSGARICSASSHERVSRITAAFACAACGVEATDALDCAEHAGALASAKIRETARYRADALNVFDCVARLMNHTSHLVRELSCDGASLDSGIEIV